MREGALLTFPLQAPSRNGYLTSNIRRWAGRESSWMSPRLSWVEIALGIFLQIVLKSNVCLYVCLYMHSTTHICICTIRISHKQKQSFKSICICWKFWRTFCSKDFWLLDFNIAAFSLAPCASLGHIPLKTLISISAVGLTVDNRLCSHPTWGKATLLFEDYLALCLTGSGMLKNCLQVRYHHFILQQTSTFPVVTERLQTNTGIYPRLQKKYYLHMHFYPALLVPLEI